MVWKRWIFTSPRFCPDDCDRTSFRLARSLYRVGPMFESLDCLTVRELGMRPDQLGAATAIESRMASAFHLCGVADNSAPTKDVGKLNDDCGQLSLLRAVLSPCHEFESRLWTFRVTREANSSPSSSSIKCLAGHRSGSAPSPGAKLAWPVTSKNLPSTGRGIFVTSGGLNAQIVGLGADMSTREHQTRASLVVQGIPGTGTAGGTDGVANPDTILRRVLAPRNDEAPAGGFLREASVSVWTGATGILSDGCTARLGASRLLRPAPGDRVMIWSGDRGRNWVLSVLLRTADDATAVLAVPGPFAIEAPRIGISARAVHIVAEDFLTSTRNRHAVEETRTETTRVRVARIDTDIRRANTADDAIKGTFLQRAGTWISNTTREARLRARTFLFD